MEHQTISGLVPVARKLARRSPLDEGAISAIGALPYRIQQLPAGAYIAREGDRLDRCCALLGGFAYRHKCTGNGGRQILSVAMRGDLLELQNGLLGYADHSVQALTCVQLALIPLSAVADLIAEHPSIGMALWRDNLVDASLLREGMLSLGRRDARQRIAHLLCELAVRQEAANASEGPVYHWPMTQEQVGDATGLTAVHVNRTIQKMRSDRLISTSTSTVEILDREGLQSAGDFNPSYLHEKQPMPTAERLRAAS
jgi:CRP-like cAMP-binding protein